MDKRKPIADYETTEAVRSLVKEIGLAKASERLHASPEACTRVLAGLPVRRGTLALVEAGLAAGKAEP